MNLNKKDYLKILDNIMEAQEIVHTDPTIAKKIMQTLEMDIRQIKTNWEKTQVKMAKKKIKELKQ